MESQPGQADSVVTDGATSQERAGLTPRRRSVGWRPHSRERGHRATLRARGSVGSGTRRSKMTLVLLLGEREREKVPGGTTLIHSTG